jgi:hypothetical protein
MAWYELAMNPSAISSLYVEVPPLQSVHIRELTLEHTGNVLVSIDLPKLPNKVPIRWKRQVYVTMYLQLQLFHVQQLHLSGWSTSNLVDLSIRKEDQKYLISSSNTASGYNIQCISDAFRINWIKKV